MFGADNYETPHLDTPFPYLFFNNKFMFVCPPPHREQVDVRGPPPSSSGPPCVRYCPQPTHKCVSTLILCFDVHPHVEIQWMPQATAISPSPSPLPAAAPLPRHTPSCIYTHLNSHARIKQITTLFIQQTTVYTAMSSPTSGSFQFSSNN